MSFATLLIHRCTIARKTYGAKDAHGQETEAWADIATDVHCRLAWQSELYMTQEWYDGKVVTVPRYVLYLPKSQSIVPRDRVTNITHKNGTLMDAGPFDVLEANTRSDKHGPHHVECLVRRVIEAGT